MATVVIYTGKGHIKWDLSNNKASLLMDVLNEIGTRESTEPDKCPNCETSLYPWKMAKIYDKRFCPDCGKKFDPHTIELMESKESGKCPNCEVPHPWKMTMVDKGFCPRCGKHLGFS